MSLLSLNTSGRSCAFGRGQNPYIQILVLIKIGSGNEHRDTFSNLIVLSCGHLHDTLLICNASTSSSNDPGSLCIANVWETFFGEYVESKDTFSCWRQSNTGLIRKLSGMLLTVKPVCNDHLYNKIYYMWFIQQCVLMKTEGPDLHLLTISAFWSTSRWPLPPRWAPEGRELTH